jgi:DNA mismatch repair protein MSH6
MNLLTRKCHAPLTRLQRSLWASRGTTRRKVTFSAPDISLSSALTPHCVTLLGPVTKKSRASVILSDEEDEAEISRSEATSIRATSEPRTSSVLMDSEEDTPARARKANVKSLAARRAAGKARSHKSSSGVSSGYDSDDFIAADEDEDDPQPRVRSKPKTKASKDIASQSSVQTAGSSNSFLTAAERRAQSKKEEKKASETTYTFLQTRRDVSFAICAQPPTSFV